MHRPATAMKYIVLFIAALALALGASAQTSLIATLSHNGEVTTYYNSNAFTEAYNAAVDGDIITLSAGTFAAPSPIAKSLTIRGAGMMVEENPTIISNSIDAKLNSDNGYVNFEGLVFSSINVAGKGNYKFTKCRIRILNFGYDVCYVNYINCICDQSRLGNNHRITAVNSFFANGGASGTFYGNYTNCVLNLKDSYSSDKSASYSNCIIYSSKSYLLGASTVRNCIYVGPNENFFNPSEISILSNNLSLPADTPIFKENTTTYELTEENAANWLGSDGTQVGMHGGALPFDPNTTLPKITKFNVASKTTANGKLAVDIEVNVQ